MIYDVEKDLFPFRDGRFAFSRERLRPHACNDGWVTIGQIAVDPETGQEIEEYALYLCRRCNA